MSSGKVRNGSNGHGNGKVHPIRELDQYKSLPEWNDWRWQMRKRIRTAKDLLHYFPELSKKPKLLSVIGKYPMAIPPYYASLIQTPDNSDPIFQMAVPQTEELSSPAYLQADPLAEEEHMPVPGLVHRYPDRALLFATTTCSMYCRHCTRKRVVGVEASAVTAAELKEIHAYLKATPQIRDVIISGGDPLTLSIDVLEKVIATVRSVESIDIIRIGTRIPVVMPQRVTDELCDMLKKYHPIWINTHFNHPVELTAESKAACEKLANAGVPMGNQAVLMRGINDDPHVLEQLFRGLIRSRVRPYYLFQCDLVEGADHFRTPITRGIQIMEYLRGRLSGLAIPNFVVDLPNGGGKIPVLPNYIMSMSPTHTVFRNGEGMIVSYPEPAHQDGYGESVADTSWGIWEMTRGRKTVMAPANGERSGHHAQVEKLHAENVQEPAASEQTPAP